MGAAGDHRCRRADPAPATCRSLLRAPARPCVRRTFGRARRRSSESWQLAGSGGQIVLIGGDAGSGKTRLATEFCRLAHADGAAVLLGSCDDDLAVAYQPWVQVVDELFASLPIPGTSSDLAKAARAARSVARPRGAAGARPSLAATRSGVGALPAVRGVCRGPSRGGGPVADGRRARRSALGRRADARAASAPRQVRAAGGVARRRHLPRHERRAHRTTRRLSRRPPSGRRRRPRCAWRASTANAIERFVSEAIGHPLDADFKDLAAQLGDAQWRQRLLPRRAVARPRRQRGGPRWQTADGSSRIGRQR